MLESSVCLFVIVYSSIRGAGEASDNIKKLCQGVTLLFFFWESHYVSVQRRLLLRALLYCRLFRHCKLWPQGLQLPRFCTPESVFVQDLHCLWDTRERRIWERALGMCHCQRDRILMVPLLRGRNEQAIVTLQSKSSKVKSCSSAASELLSVCVIYVTISAVRDV